MVATDERAAEGREPSRRARWEERERVARTGESVGRVPTRASERPRARSDAGAGGACVRACASTIGKKLGNGLI